MRAYKTISCSVTGYRKKTGGLACEDATRVIHTSVGTVAAVADGHGDKRCLFASIGAILATKAACDALKRYLKAAPDDVAAYWNSLRREIAIDICRKFACYAVEDYRVRCKDRITNKEAQELEQHIREYFENSEQALTPSEMREKYMNRKFLNDKLSKILLLYGTTVRASVLTDAYIFNCALGDGDTVAVINDRVEWLLPQTEAYACETASLCEPFETAVESFLFSFVECKAAPSGGSAVSNTAMFVPTLMLCTDGLRNCFFSASLFEKKVLDISRSAHLGRKETRASNLKRLYEKLSMQSVFQDDISTVIAIRNKKI